MTRCLQVLCALSLVLSAYAAGAMPRAELDPATGAFLAGGGTLADLCVDGDFFESHAECMACRLAETLSHVPMPDWAPKPLVVADRVTCLAPLPALHRRAGAPPPPARAPPTL